jgi:hypothetical protein
MESQSTHAQEMIILIQDIMNTIALASAGENHRWYIYFNGILENLNKPNNLEEIVHKMQPIFGGMGTFNDLTY